jgi:glycosyltransferase involved in cell wall biosynthesis
MMADAPVKVLHFSSTKRDKGCGVARYQEAYVSGMADMPGVVNKFFAVSPYQTRIMNAEELEVTMRKLSEELKDYDILHIQHEFGLYWHNQFARIVETGKAAGKKVIVTIHLSPANVKEIAPVKLGGFGPHSIVAYLRQLRHHNAMVQEHIVPMRTADMLIVHTDITAKYLVGLGIDPERITKLEHPVYEVSAPPVSHEVAEALDKQPGDIIFCITGYLHRYKHVTDAVRALKFLPANYKLALLGGIKADSDDIGYENRITNLVDRLGIAGRVYISGFIADDERLDALIRECDVCVYPYDRVYYANANSGALGLAFSNSKPAIAYPIESIKEVDEEVKDAVILCQTFAYYELARELKRIDIPHQVERSKAYAKKLAWPKMAVKLADLYVKIGL